ncbi:hypothetical protein CesoFtcFv8_026326 [Champsocephalus esox]|uniref:Uncharacterized protein n=1 Tax=Champsocephalus esox TaxID=159716 RepID=A0AAN8B246_9TELE|nr:hypothetical protein CesoFtcFv8_026326 [Champsocephalus esox]
MKGDRRAKLTRPRRTSRNNSNMSEDYKPDIESSRENYNSQPVSSFRLDESPAGFFLPRCLTQSYELFSQLSPDGKMAVLTWD